MSRSPKRIVLNEFIRLSIISGIISDIPTISSFKVWTIVSAPSLPIDPNAVKPATRTAMPKDTAIQDKPRDAIEVLSCNIDGIKGRRSLAAIPIEANAPAKIIRPCAAFAGSTAESVKNAPARPVTKNISPAPVAAVPAPSTTSEAPIVAIDPAKEYIVGMSGRMILVARPMIVMAPAKAIKLVATPMIPVFEIRTIADENIISAPETRSNAATEPSRPFTASRPIMSAFMAPPRATIEDIDPSMPIPDRDPIASATLNSESVTMGMATDNANMSPISILSSCSIIFIKRAKTTVIETNAPAIS